MRSAKEAVHKEAQNRASSGCVAAVQSPGPGLKVTQAACDPSARLTNCGTAAVPAPCVFAWAPFPDAQVAL